MGDARALSSELRSTLARVELALSLVQDCLVWTDEAGRVLWCNSAFDALTGRPHIELLGTELIAWLPLEEDGRPLPTAQHPVNLVLNDHAEVFGSYEMSRLRSPRETLVLEIFARGRAIQDDRLAIFVLHDVTDRAHVQEMRRLNMQLEATNRELEAFSYSVSHDLRTPLRAIDGFSQALMEDYSTKLDPEGKDFLQRIRAAAQRMARLIDDLLMLSRVTRTKLRYDDVNLSAAARNIAEELRSLAPGRPAEFLIQDGIVVRGDRQLLRLALENLLANAWKFTSKVPVARIELAATRRDGQIIVSVRDNGAGFDMALAGKLFGAFQRLHSDTEFPGTGIGLATVRRIIHRHEGRVWAEATPSSGATFYFGLPERNTGEEQHGT